MDKIFSVLILLLIIITGCSSNQQTPVTPVDISTDIPTGEMEAESRQLLGVWELDFNYESQEAIVTPSRLANTHYQVKYLIPTPGIVINTIHPNYVIDADVTLTNPFTFDAYDIRLILFTDDEPHKLENPDCWTSLYDIPIGMPINPFKAYAKDEPNRVFAGGTNHTENLLVFSPPGSHPIQFAIDASFPGNCEEPYEITDFTQGVLHDVAGSSTLVEVTVRDWQEDVCEVQLYCPEITGGALLAFEQINPETWKVELINETGALSGDYDGYIIAKSSNSGPLALYDVVTITISAFSTNPSNPQIVSTIGGMSMCLRIAIYNDLVFCASDYEGVKVFDITQPCSPRFVSTIDSVLARDVAVDNDFLYIADGSGGFKIVDVSDLINPVDVGLIPTLFAHLVVASGDYAYVVDSSGLNIVDVSDPNNPEIVPNSLGYSCVYDLTIDGDYLYLINNDYGNEILSIIDIDEPASPEVIKEIQFDRACAVDVHNGYAYVPNNYKLKIFDVSDPHTANEVGSIDISYIDDIAGSGDYVFVACESSGLDALKVVDVSNPSMPVEMGSVELNGPRIVVAKGNYAFVADNMESLKVIDVNNPSEPSVCGFYRLESCQDVIIENDYAYLVCRTDGIYIVDIADPSMPIIISHIDSFYDITGADVEGDYLYFADDRKFVIVDISNPAIHEIVSTLDMGSSMIWNFKVRGDFAYIPDNLSGFIIVNISNPAEPEIVSTNSSVYSARDVVIEGNYAYVSCSTSSYSAFQVLEISDPTETSMIGFWSSSNCRGIAKQGDYIYLGHLFLNALNILDVSDPTSPEEASTVITEHQAGDVAVQGNYAYIAGFEPAGGGGLEIVDITDPTEAVLFSSLITDGHASAIAVEGRYAYLADLDGGMKIIKLW